MNDLFWNFFFFGARLLMLALVLFALIEILVIK